MCRCGCHTEFYRDHHMCHHRGYDFPLMSVEEEVKSLEEMKEGLEKRLNREQAIGSLEALNSRHL